ncbi:MAG TPA: hypothetical protein PK668_13040 [Myxococcota bacterium]|nr:hypothetical protein [Myxococcota bacterium]HRY93605.1 hypothetical protein [Myxococcota bacterium]
MTAWTEHWRTNEEDQLLIANGQTCCLCLEEGDAHVRRLADDAQAPSDLAVLCERCSKRLDGFPSRQRSVGPNGIRIAQRAFLAYVKRPSEVFASSDEDTGLLSTASVLWGDGFKTKNVEPVYATWFAMTACQVLGDPSNVPQAERLLGTLTQAFFWRKDPTIRLMVYDAISRVAECHWRKPFSPLVPAVAHALGSLGAHLIHPEDVEEKKKADEDDWAARRIDAKPWVKANAWLAAPLFRLESLGSRALTVPGVDAVATEVENTFVRGLWCKDAEVVSAAAKAISMMLKKHRGGDDGRPPFPEGEARLQMAAVGLLELLHGEKSRDWKGPRKVLRALAGRPAREV